MNHMNDQCNFLADILNGKSEMDNGVCMVTVKRKDIQATIANRPFKSIEHMFSFESEDINKNALITGEMVFLENEVPNAVSSLSNMGIIVSAIHSHWLYDNPKLIYIHVEAIMNPVTFAQNVKKVIGHSQ